MSEGETPDTERVTTLAAIEPGRPQPFLPTGRSFTVDDLLEFPDDGNRYELCDGALLTTPAPSPLHQRVVCRLLGILDDALPDELEPLPAVNVRVSGSDFSIPDLVVVPTAMTEKVELMFAPAHLLLVVEVSSPRKTG